MNSSTDPAERRSLLACRASFPCWAKDQVRWSDTDLIGHANHLSVATYVETGRGLLMRELLSGEGPERLVLLTVQLLVNYRGESHWPDEIDIGTGVLTAGKTSLCLGSGVFVGERCIATAETTLVLIDDATRRSRALPEWLREWLSARAIRSS